MMPKAAGGLRIRLLKWDKIVQKYGKAAADSAQQKAMKKTVVFAADLVKRRLVGKHHVTGFLVNSITASVGSKTTGEVFAKRGFGVYYAGFVEEGTGIHGPSHMSVVPKTKRKMAWHPTSVTGRQTGSRKIVRGKTAGQKPVGYMKETRIKDRKRIVDQYQRTFASAFGELF